MVPGPARKDLLVLGVGNPLRGDDGVGISLVRRLREVFGDGLACKELLAPDVILAVEFAEYDHLVIVDALAGESTAPFHFMEISPSPISRPTGGLISHCFDWPAILAVAQTICGKAPQTRVLGVAAESFDLCETLSPACCRNADLAFSFLVSFCRRKPMG